MSQNRSDYITRLLVENAQYKAKLSESRSAFKKHNAAIENMAKNAASSLGKVFGGFAVASFVQDVIKVTGEFQKFEAVLTNTLGSNSDAQKALNDIKQFGATTPFQVNELTQSYIKLANQGFKPTLDQMRKLGDLASSTGKSFDQLTEAVIDAQVGEFERLKEFGIRASKQGDKVTFTFKGVKKQVDFTQKSIQDYLLSLGDAKGVTGSMAAISGTLEGKLSNLQDNFDELKRKIGEVSAEPLDKIVRTLNEMLTAVSNVDLVLSTMFKTFGMLSNTEIFRLVDAGMVTDSGKNVRELLAPLVDAPVDQIQANFQQIRKSVIDSLVKEGESLKQATQLVDAYFDVFNKNKGVFETGPTSSLQGLIIPDKAITQELAKSQRKASEAIDTFVQDSADWIVDGIDTAESLLVNDLRGLFESAVIGVKSGTGPLSEAIGGVVESMNMDYSTQISDAWDKNTKALNESFTAFMEQYQQGAELIGIAESTIEDAIGATVEGLVDGGIDNAFQAFFKVFGDGLKNMGKALVAQGIALKAAALTLDPFTKIAAGVAAIAAGALISKTASSMSSDMGGAGGGGSSFGGFKTSATGQNSFPTEIRMVAEGDQLVGVLKTTSQKQERTMVS